MSAAIINLCREISAGHSKVSSACFSNLFVCYFVCDGRLPFRLKVPSSQKPFEVTSLNVNSKKREGSQLTKTQTVSTWRDLLKPKSYDEKPQPRSKVCCWEVAAGTSTIS